MASLDFKGVVLCGYCGDWFGDSTSYEDHSRQHIPTAHAPAIKGSGSSLSHATKPRDVCTVNRCSRRTHGDCTNSFVCTRSRCGAHVELEIDGECPSAVLDLYKGSGIREPACVSAYCNPDCVGSGLQHDGYGHERYAYLEKACRSDGDNAIQRQNCRMYNDTSSELYSLMDCRVPDQSFPVAGCKDAGSGNLCSKTVDKTVEYTFDSPTPSIPNFSTNSAGTLDVCRVISPYVPYSQENASSFRCSDILDDYLDNKGSFTAENGVFMTSVSGKSRVTSARTIFCDNLQDLGKSVSNKEEISGAENVAIDNDHGERLITSDHAYPVVDHANRVDDVAHPVDDHDQVDDHAHQIADQSQIENPGVEPSPEVTKYGTRLDQHQEAATVHAGSEYYVLYDGFSLCHVCGRTMLSWYAMRRHLWIHEKPRNACKLCGKTYNSKSNLVRHVNIIHLGQRFPCSQCLQTFSTIHSLKRHGKIHARVTAAHNMLSLL